jgi:hypothetical protein
MPLLGKLRMAALNGEGRVVVFAISGEERGELGGVSLLPRVLVVLHELLNAHDVPQMFSVPNVQANRRAAPMPPRNEPRAGPSG